MGAPVRPSLERVRELLAYDPEAGVLTWRVQRCQKAPGDEAGYVAPNGYRYVSLDGRMELSHCLIWLLQTGAWPPRKIDHRDRKTANNRWKNLRLATNSQNGMNSHLRSTSTSGQRGVSFDRRRGNWRAYITAEGKRRDIGRFATKEAAVAARLAAERKHFGEFAPC